MIFKLVLTNIGAYLTPIYGDVVQNFNAVMAETLLPHQPLYNAIDLAPNMNVSYGWRYRISEFRLKVLKAAIDANEAN